MKKAILLLLTFTSFQALAVNWKVGPVKAEVQVRGDLVLTRAVGYLLCEYRRIGELNHLEDRQNLPTTLIIKNSTTYTLSIGSGNLISRPNPLFWPRRNCRYSVIFWGHSSRTGKEAYDIITFASARGLWRNKSLAADLTKEYQQKPLILELTDYGRVTDPRIERVE